MSTKLVTHQFGKEIRIYDASEMILERECVFQNEIVENYKYKAVWAISKIVSIG